MAAMAFGIPYLRVRKIHAMQNKSRASECRIAASWNAPSATQIPWKCVSPSVCAVDNVTQTNTRVHVGGCENCGPFWIPIIIRHLILGYPERDHRFDNHPCRHAYFHTTTLTIHSPRLVGAFRTQTPGRIQKNRSPIYTHYTPDIILI